MIKRVGGSVSVIADFSDIDSRGEVAHFITELEIIKQRLLKLWEEKFNVEER